jgi:hypothetical protein
MGKIRLLAWSATRTAGWRLGRRFVFFVLFAIIGLWDRLFARTATTSLWRRCHHERRLVVVFLLFVVLHVIVGCVGFVRKLRFDVESVVAEGL